MDASVTTPGDQSSTSQKKNKKRVCVIGAGIIGLSTALHVQQRQLAPGQGHGLGPRDADGPEKPRPAAKESPWQRNKATLGDPELQPGDDLDLDVEVTVIADRFSPNTTADGSAAFLFPHKLGDTPLPSIRRWLKATRDHIVDLATTPGLPSAVGAQFLSGCRATYQADEEDYEWKDMLLGYRQLTEEELRLFPLAKSGKFFTSMQINVLRYLPWLMRRFKEAGGKVEFKTIQSLSEVAEDYDVIVNCCGVRAGALASDPNTVPIRGQVRRVHAPWIKNFYIYVWRDGNLTYILPSGELVAVGGVAQTGNWNEDTSDTDSDDIWNRATSCFPCIKGARVVEDWAGLRPGRSSVRLEKDSLTTGTKTVQVVHNYGHGGAGVTLHWGCAADAASLVQSALRTDTSPHSNL